MQKIREQVTMHSTDKSDPFGGSGLTAAISGHGIRAKLLVALGLAVTCAIAAVYLSNAWMQSQYDRFRNANAQQPVAEKPAVTVVVAAKPLQYGVAISPGAIKEIEWPADAIPAGAFRSTKDLITSEGARVVLTSIALNEPILPGKITDPGQAASLSALLRDGYKAVTVRIDDVLGVAGLITPGDRVDVLWTRVQGTSGQADETYTEVLLRGVRVLALDQKVEEAGKVDKAPGGFAKAATLEVSTLQAQKVALATSTGKLALALQHVTEDNSDAIRRVTLSDLNARVKSPADEKSVLRDETEVADTFGVNRRPASSTPADAPQDQAGSRLTVTGEYAIVGVTRGVERREYNVRHAERPY